MNTALAAPPAKLSFKAQMLQAREDAIVQAVIRLLGEKGFDAMTVDEVAAAVGIAKASLYKHFPGKEDLAAAAMVYVIRRAQAFLQQLPPGAPPLEQLRAVVRWMIEAAQADGTLDATVPPLVVLYTLYARACDPVPEFLQASGLYTDAQILELMLRTCFNGMADPRK